MKYFQYITTLTILVLPQSLFAQDVKLKPPATKLGTTLPDFIYLLLDIVQMIGIPILAMAIIYSGFLFVTAAGNEDKVTNAKKVFTWTLVGAAVILGAKVIAAFVGGTAEQFQ